MHLSNKERSPVPSSLLSWFLRLFALAILIGIAALVLPALRKGGSYTSQADKLAVVTNSTVIAHIDRFSRSSVRFYFAVPGSVTNAPDPQENTLTGAVKVSANGKFIANHNFEALNIGAMRFTIEQERKFYAGFQIMFDGQREPACPEGKSCDLQFQLSSKPPANLILIYEHFVRRTAR